MARMTARVLEWLIKHEPLAHSVTAIARALRETDGDVATALHELECDRFIVRKFGCLFRAANENDPL